MRNQPNSESFNSLMDIAVKLRRNLDTKDFILLFAHNHTGKTRLSMEFMRKGKTRDPKGDTLYFNAFTEDLFSWDNERFVLRFNGSPFFEGLRELEMESKIRPFLHRYVDFDFIIDYDDWHVNFERQLDGESAPTQNIKVSRGEENIFIWCLFLAVAQLAIERQESYQWVKYIFIDDPISSLDDNNAIAIACDLATLLKGDNNEVRTVISTHHSLFFNVMCNEFNRKRKSYYYLSARKPNGYSLRDTKDTPYFHHVALLSELKYLSDSGIVYTYHFNALRSILEKTASFFGYDNIAKCIEGLEDEELFHRALQLLSHGRYSIFDPIEMADDNKDLFKRILNGFLQKYQFILPDLVGLNAEETNPT